MTHRKNVSKNAQPTHLTMLTLLIIFAYQHAQRHFLPMKKTESVPKNVPKSPFIDKIQQEDAFQVVFMN
jgi:hypothetical protein